MHRFVQFRMSSAICDQAMYNLSVDLGCRYHLCVCPGRGLPQSHRRRTQAAFSSTTDRPPSSRCCATCRRVLSQRNWPASRTFTACACRHCQNAISSFWIPLPTLGCAFLALSRSFLLCSCLFFRRFLSSLQMHITLRVHGDRSLSRSRVCTV